MSKDSDRKMIKVLLLGVAAILVASYLLGFLIRFTTGLSMEEGVVFTGMAALPPIAITWIVFRSCFKL